MRTVPASNFVATVAANVDNNKLSDAEFRAFIRDTLPIVIYDQPRISSMMWSMMSDAQRDSYVEYAIALCT